MFLARLAVGCLFFILSAAAYAAACSERHFLEFFVRYSNEVTFSEDRTDWPLRVTTEQFGEPKTRTAGYIPSRYEHWGLSKTISEFLKENPNMRIYVSSESKSKVILTFGIEDADIVFDLKFRKRNGCWRLYEVRDFDR